MSAVPESKMPFRHTRHGFAHALSVMGEVIAGKLGVRIRFGSNPKTDGTTIWLPHLPVGSWISETTRTLFRGHLFHESAHILFTTFGLKPRTPVESCSLFHQCENALEDPRIEVLISRRHPFTKADLIGSYRISLENGETRTGSQGPEDALITYLLFLGFTTHAHYDLFRSPLGKAHRFLSKAVPAPILQTLEELVVGRYPTLTSSEEVRDLVAEIFTLLKIEPPPPQPSQGGKGQPQPGEGSEGGSKGSNPDQDSSRKKGGPKKGQSQPDADASDDDEGNGQQQGETEADAKGEGGTPKPDAAEKQTGDGPQEGENAAQAKFDPNWTPDGPVISLIKGFLDELEKDKKQAPPGPTVHTTEEVEISPQRVLGSDLTAYEAMLVKGLSTVGLIAAKFMRLLSIARVRHPLPSYSGTIRSSKVARLYMGDARVFSRKARQVVPRCCIALVTDLSGSMAGAPARIAGEATVAMAEACRRAQLACAVYGFEGEVLHQFQSFTDAPAVSRGRLGRLPHIASRGGGTPMGEALYKVGISLLDREEERRLLIVATDGEPNNVGLTQEVIGELILLPGVEVVGVGIGSTAVKGLFPKAVVIDDVKELGGALFGVLKDSLLGS